MEKLFHLFFLVTSILILSVGLTQGASSKKSTGHMLEKRDVVKGKLKELVDCFLKYHTLPPGEPCTLEGVNEFRQFHEHAGTVKWGTRRETADLFAKSCRDHSTCSAAGVCTCEPGFHCDTKGIQRGACKKRYNNHFAEEPPKDGRTKVDADPNPDPDADVDPDAADAEKDAGTNENPDEKPKTDSGSGAGHIHGAKCNHPSSNFVLWLGVFSGILSAIGALEVGFSSP